MTFDRRVADAIEVIEFLRQHLGVDKVVLLAESMGTLTGLPLVKRRPDLFHALVVTDLYVNMAANEAGKHQLTLERLRAAGNAKGVAALEAIGGDPARWDLGAWNTNMAWAFRTNVPTPNLDRKLLFLRGGRGADQGAGADPRRRALRGVHPATAVPDRTAHPGSTTGGPAQSRIHSGALTLLARSPAGRDT
jgi:pimeloyl-ACP methyl ester carboxylesterase